MCLKQVEMSSELTAVINVTTMTGDLAAIVFKPEMTIDRLKVIINDRLKVDPNKQLLMYNGISLEVCLEQSYS